MGIFVENIKNGIMQKLSAGVISLIHHIKLNEAGWQEKSIQSLIISAIGNNSNNNMPIYGELLFKKLTEEINPSLNRQAFDNEIEKLANTGKIELISNGYVLEESVNNDFQQQLLDQIEIEDKTYNLFIKYCTIHAPHLSAKDIWHDFKEILLTGRITGVTFIDHENRCVLNGSRLGKEYSANALNERYPEAPKAGADLHGISYTLPEAQISPIKAKSVKKKKRPHGRSNKI